MNAADFELLSDLLRKKSGLMVTPDKAYYLESRLTPIAKQWNFNDITAMVLKLRGMADSKLIDDIVDAMTTNETSFFRDRQAFEQFETTILPHVLNKRGAKKLRIWCVAASTGQEPYSVAMFLNEQGLYDKGWNIEIVGTDINQSVLEHAREGLYTQFEVQRGVPIQYLMKYFTQKNDKWQVNDDLRSKVQFQKLNLLNPLNALGQFDVIFCGNVLVYLDRHIKADLLDRMGKQIANDGFLLLGKDETIDDVTQSFKDLSQDRGLYALTHRVHLSK